jgi:hypothetical protein
MRHFFDAIKGKPMKFNFVSIFLGVLLLLGGCSSGGTSDSTHSDGDSSSETITLNGTLLAGAIAGSSVRSVSQAVVAKDYTVVAVSNDSNETYRTTTNANGLFSLNLPAKKTFLFNYIHRGSYIGPTVFGGTGTKVYSAITVNSDTNLGNITLDETTGYAVTKSTPEATDTAITTVALNGIPVGAGNDGKTTQSQITSTRQDSDADMDGIPNIFDADEDNDGIRNGILSSPSSAEVESDDVESVYMSSNIWADHDTTDTAYDLMALRLHVMPVQGREARISKVECIDVPAAISEVATVRRASSLGEPVNYPAERSLWRDADYGLYRTTTLDPEEWIISITPKAQMAVGDTFTIRVTYTDNSYEDFFITTSYFIQDWATIASYNGTPMPTDSGTKSNPVTFNTNTLAIVINQATDEDGEKLAGLSYSVRYGLADCSSGPCSVPTNATEEPVTASGGDTLTFQINTSVSGTYYVTPVAQTADGQRNGEETWFKRQ